ncbi:hypothetical protein GALLN_00358 [Gallionellaceae bacterium]|nr:hypothetical protein GALLN_00358 [Gallionellaceae bacterium]
MRVAQSEESEHDERQTAWFRDLRVKVREREDANHSLSNEWVTFNSVQERIHVLHGAVFHHTRSCLRAWN